MKHRIFGKKLGRTTNQRKALINGLTRQVFTYGSIETTEAKAKAVLSTVEKTANIAVKDTLNARRELFKIFQDQNWVNTIVERMKSVFGDQTSNFTKIRRLRRRQGDDALVVNLAFVKPIDFKPVKVEEVKKEDKKAVAPKKAAVKKTPAKKTVKKETK